MDLVKFNRNRNLTNPGFNDIFDSFFNDTFITGRLRPRVPDVNICETKANYHIELAARGLKKEDFKINLNQGMLTVSAGKQTKSKDERKKYKRREYSYTFFVRSFALPESAGDARIEARYTDGVLQIDAAKKEETKLSGREISIK